MQLDALQAPPRGLLAGAKRGQERLPARAEKIKREGRPADVVPDSVRRPPRRTAPGWIDPAPVTGFNHRAAKNDTRGDDIPGAQAARSGNSIPPSHLREE